MIFRRGNEKVTAALEALDAMHIEDGNGGLIQDDELLLRFKCECSDENCKTRIPLTLSEYREIHEDRKQFVLVPNHEVSPIEDIMKKTSDYIIVKKKHAVPEPQGGLNATSIDNS